MNALRLSLAVLSYVLLVPAYASSYDEPDEKTPSAELRIISSTSGIAASSWVDGYSSEACPEKDDEGRLATFNVITRGKKVVRVRVGARLYVLAGAHIEPPVGAEVRKTTCLSMASFVPETGKAYEIKHDLITRNCPIEIKEASGAELKTFQKHKPKDLCKKKF